MTVASQPQWRVLWYGLATVLAVFTYFYGLDSEHIPKNGDEYPYEHITRLTAASGQCGTLSFPGGPGPACTLKLTGSGAVSKLVCK